MTPRRRRLLVPIFILAATILSSAAQATTGTGQLDITNKINIFYQDWIGPIASMFAIAGLVFGLIQIGLGRGPDAFTNAVRWLVVAALVIGLVAILGTLGITAATV